MDWRTGKPNTTGSAFRGITSRGRGRGRGRSTLPSGRGGHNAAATDSVLSISALPEASPAQESHTSSLNDPPRPKPSARRGSHQHHTRRAPSLSHLELPKPSVPFEEQQISNSRPKIPRRASPIGTSPAVDSLSSVKGDSPSSSSTQTSHRSKAPRKRSHNRTRSTSKASTQDHILVAPCITSPREQEKETPPHLALASAPPDVQSFDLRTNIDTLVERVRAMAMAGSAIERGKDKEGHPSSNEGHIDWAGDDDDTLPDLDDWVRPKSVEPKGAQVAGDEKPVSSHVGKPDPSITASEEGKGMKNKDNGAPQEVKKVEKSQSPTRETRDPKSANESRLTNSSESTSGRMKTRGKHTRKKSSISGYSPLEAGGLPTAAKPRTGGLTAQTITDTNMTTPKMRPSLVHPLPPKPHLSTWVSKPRAPPQATQSVVRSTERVQQPALENTVLEPPFEPIAKGITPSTTNMSTAFNPPNHWPKSGVEAKDSEDGAESAMVASTPQVLDIIPGRGQQPRSTGSSPTRRSPTPNAPFSKRADPFPSSVPHPPTVPNRSPVHVSPPQESAPFVFPDSVHEIPHPVQTRSQMNSPHSSPRRWPHREGATHCRSHSSPQAGTGTRSHGSRPVITLDAISRLSRTLGVPGATTPPRGPAIGVAVNE